MSRGGRFLKGGALYHVSLQSVCTCAVPEPTSSQAQAGRGLSQREASGRGRETPSRGCRGGRGGGLGRGLGRGCCLEQGPAQSGQRVCKRSGGSSSRGLAASSRSKERTRPACVNAPPTRTPAPADLPNCEPAARVNRRGGCVEAAGSPSSPCLKNMQLVAVVQSQRGGSQTWLGRVGRGEWNRNGCWGVVALPRSRVSGSGTFR